MICLPTLGNHIIYSKMKLAVTLNRLVVQSHICNINTKIFYFKYFYLHANLLHLKPNTYYQFRATVLHTRSLEEGSGWVVQWIRVSSQYAKAVGSIPGEGTYKNQPTNVEVKWNNKSMFLFL